MKYIKYILVLLLFTNCDKDSAEEQEPVEQYIPIGEVIYTPTSNPHRTWLTNVEVMNDSIFVAGAYQPNQDDEGIYMARFNDSLEIDINEFPVNGLFQVETRRVESHSFNNHLYVSHSYTSNVYAFSTLMKLNTDGDLIWEVDIPFSFMTVDIISRNNNIIVYGRNWNGANSYNQPNSVLTFDDSGNLINQIDLNSNYTSGNNILLLDDNTFVLTNLKRDEGPDDMKPTLVNLDAEGNILWETQLGYYDDFVFRFDLFHIKKGTDGIFFTYTGRIGNPPQIGKVTFDGELLWRWEVSNLWFNDTFEQIEDLTVDQNNNIYLIGSKRSNNSGDLRMALAKYDSEGRLVRAITHPPAGYWGQSFKILNNELVTASRDFTNDLVSLIKFDFDLEIR